jgi:hypothetical protein
MADVFFSSEAVDTVVAVGVFNKFFAIDHNVFVVELERKVRTKS